MILKIVVCAVQDVIVGAAESRPQCGVQSLDELRKGVEVYRKHMEERSMIAAAFCLKVGVALKETIVCWVNSIRLGDGMRDAAEETGER